MGEEQIKAEENRVEISVLKELSLQCLLNMQVEISSRQMNIWFWGLKGNGVMWRGEEGWGLIVVGTATLKSGKEEKSVKETGKRREGIVR